MLRRLRWADFHSIFTADWVLVLVSVPLLKFIYIWYFSLTIIRWAVMREWITGRQQMRLHCQRNWQGPHRQMLRNFTVRIFEWMRDWRVRFTLRIGRISIDWGCDLLHRTQRTAATQRAAKQQWGQLPNRDYVPKVKSPAIQHRQTGQNVAAGDGKRAMNAHSLRWRSWRIVYNLIKKHRRICFVGVKFIFTIVENRMKIWTTDST